MDSNFRFTVRKLPDGNFLLCDGEDRPVLVGPTGRIQLNQHGTPMTYQAEKPAPPSRAHVEGDESPSC